MELDDAINAASALALLAGAAIGMVVGNKFTLKQVRDGDHDGYVYLGPTDIRAELTKADENNQFIAAQMSEIDKRLRADVALDEAIGWVDMAEKDVEVLGRVVEETLEALRRAHRLATDPKVAHHAKRDRSDDASHVPLLDEAISRTKAFQDDGLPLLVQACADRRTALGEAAGS